MVQRSQGTCGQGAKGKSGYLGAWWSRLAPCMHGGGVLVQWGQREDTCAHDAVGVGDAMGVWPLLVWPEG